MTSRRTRFALFTFAFMLAGRAAVAESAGPWRFEFGSDQPAAGQTHVASSTVYSDDRGYGFKGATDLKEAGGCVTSDKPFFFSIKLPEGNYNVALTLGSTSEASDTTVKAEQRRLMLEAVRTAPGRFVTRTITVNVRTPKISAGEKVHLKTRELSEEQLEWDDQLTLEFNGPRPCVREIDVTRADDVPTVYILGDSTVCDQPLEPWNSWGQMLPRFFKPGVAVANNAESGETLRSSLHANRLAKVLSTMKQGDYLLIQFGHNDMKGKGPGVGAFTTYKADLEHFVTEARGHGGTPVLITSMNRKSFDSAGKIVNTLKDYPDAVRAVAKEMNVPLIDLNAMSKTLYESIGPRHMDAVFQDGTHHKAYGSYELARCVIEGIREDKLPLARYIADDVASFDPSRPDPVASFDVPASPQRSMVKPLGN